ncbi:MAG: SecDF P1 head subdomain-containing protein [Planctomycetota bacterium]
MGEEITFTEEPDTPDNEDSIPYETDRNIIKGITLKNKSNETWTNLELGIVIVSAITVFRFISFISEFLFVNLRNVESIITSYIFNIYTVMILSPAICVAFAVIVSRWLSRWTARKSKKVQVVAFIIFLLLAFQPLHFSNIQEPVLLAIDNIIDQTPITPISLKLKLIDGEIIDRDVIIDEQNIVEAEVHEVSVSPYAVWLLIDRSGTQQLQEVTKNNIGKSLGVFLDEKLIYVAQIKSDLVGNSINIPAVYFEQEAKTITRRLNASKKQ